MKKFIFYIISIVVSVHALLFILDKAYTFIYSNGTPRNKISYLLSIEGKTLDYVFIGSSRVDNNIDPEVIERYTGGSAINLGIQGAEINDYLLVLQLLKKQNINTKTVFIQIDYVYNLSGSSDFLKSTLMPYIEDDVISSYIRNQESEFYYLRNIPFYRYLRYDYKLGFRETFLTAIGKESKLNVEKGYWPKFGYSGKKFEARLPEKILAENENLAALESFAAKNGFKIVYFTAPFCYSTENINFIDKLQNKLPGLWNFSRVFQKNEVFFDCLHLNDVGAKRFSKILSEKINSDLKGADL